MVGIAAGLLLGAPGTTFGLQSSPAEVHVVATEPVADAPAPLFWDDQFDRRVGARAYRFELHEPDLGSDMSVWYHLAYVVGGDRLQLYEHNPSTTQDPDSEIAKSQNIAWHAATSVLGWTSGVARPGEIPDWARPRTGNLDGRSGGLLYALADIDLLTPGPLAGGLRVAATGSVSGDGTIAPVRHVDAKLAAAQLAQPDVFFSRTIPDGPRQVVTIEDQQGPRTANRAIGDWLNTAGYERAGTAAAAHPGTMALVQLHDVRQALSWLCGRTQLAATCTLAENADAISLRVARPYNPPRPPSPTASDAGWLRSREQALRNCPAPVPAPNGGSGTFGHSSSFPLRNVLPGLEPGIRTHSTHRALRDGRPVPDPDRHDWQAVWAVGDA